MDPRVDPTDSGAVADILADVPAFDVVDGELMPRAPLTETGSERPIQL